MQILLLHSWAEFLAMLPPKRRPIYYHEHVSKTSMRVTPMAALPMLLGSASVFVYWTNSARE